MAGLVPFDKSVLKTNQGTIIALNALAYILQAPLLVAFVGLVMLVGTADPRFALFQQLYLRVLKPRGLVRPRVVMDDPVPHRFTQGLGGSFLAAATLAFAVGADLLGWSLAALVVALAFIAFAFDYCVGCQIFLLARRVGIVRRA